MERSDDFRLIPVTAEMRESFAASREDFSRMVGLQVPDGWPEFPEAFGPLSGAPSPAPWTGYLFAVGDELVGNGGFVGPPDPANMVEIGYEIAPAYRGRGYATRAVERLIDVAFDQGATGVCAHSLAETNASNRVMLKAGMSFAEAVPNEEVGEVWRFERRLADSVAAG